MTWMLLACLGACGDDEATPEAETAVNRVPTISGTAPVTAQAGSEYSFQPAASDADGDALQFSAAGLPAWASIDGSTGRLSGTPSDGAVGAWGPITVTVSDGEASTALAPFTITVAGQQATVASATLSWLPPTTNADGTVLTDLTGYRIEYGLSSGALDRTIDIDNPSINTYVVEQLTPGTWYFSVIALNARRVESPPSNLGSKRIG